MVVTCQMWCVTECMNGSSVDEWFLNNYKTVMDE